MTTKSEWQEANRRLMAEERQRLGDPPTAEEMLAYSRGELPESEEERIRDLLVAYPEIARMYGAAFPEEGDAVTEEELAAGWKTLQQRLGGRRAVNDSRAESQRGRVVFRRYVPSTIAAALALVFFGLFVQAETRARHFERQSRLPRLLGAPQELVPDGNRGPDSATLLRQDGEAYWLKLPLINQVRYPHYRIELRDARGTTIWSGNAAQPDQDDAFQIVVPHELLRSGQTYQLRIAGVDGKTQTTVGMYDVAVAAE